MPFTKPLSNIFAVITGRVVAGRIMMAVEEGVRHTRWFEARPVRGNLDYAAIYDCRYHRAFNRAAGNRAYWEQRRQFCAASDITETLIRLSNEARGARGGAAGNAPTV
ncbi:MAG: hypothetical protein V4621_04905 [Pseudomonadota bacterium]